MSADKTTTEQETYYVHTVCFNTISCSENARNKVMSFYDGLKVARM
jgi:hypothetical protein